MRDTEGIVLTGGIGSGKSTAASILSGFGAAVVSADRAGHRVLEPDGAAFAAVAARWPEAIAGGRVDRSRLAGIVFADPAALRELESITHPAIARLIAAEVAVADAPLVVLEIPLLEDLLGAGWPVVVVDAPDEIRRLRLVARGMDPGDVARRMSIQPDRAEWLAAADAVIDNGGGLEHLEDECRNLWVVLTGEAPPGSPARSTEDR